MELSRARRRNEEEAHVDGTTILLGTIVVWHVTCSHAGMGHVIMPVLLLSRTCARGERGRRGLGGVRTSPSRDLDTRPRPRTTSRGPRRVLPRTHHVGDTAD